MPIWIFKIKRITLTDEQQTQSQIIKLNPELIFKKEKAAKSLAYYHELKYRYDNPESKVYKNDWFLKTHVNPAWQNSVNDHQEFMLKKSSPVFK